MRAGDDVRIVKLDERANEVASYAGRVVQASDELVVAACTWTWKRSVDVGPFTLEPGDRLCEFYFPNAWFNVFRVCDEKGALKGWYCNVTAPPDMGGDQIRWRDLKLDLVVGVDGQEFVSDQDEFELLDPSPDLRGQADKALAILRSWHRQGAGPFAKDGICTDTGSYGR
jgi:protein associated with RNAse G/E